MKKTTAAEYRVQFQKSPHYLYNLLDSLPREIADTWQEEKVSESKGRYISKRRAVLCVQGVKAFLRGLPQGNARESVAAATQLVFHSAAALNGMAGLEMKTIRLVFSGSGKPEIKGDAFTAFIPGCAQPKAKAEKKEAVVFLTEAEKTEADAAAAAARADAAAAAAAADNALRAFQTATAARDAADAAAAAAAAAAENREKEAAAAKGKAKQPAAARAAAARADADAAAAAAAATTTEAAARKAAYVAAREAVSAAVGE
jgi:hypothetical protein